MAKLAYNINIWLKYLLQLKKSWIKKGKLSKSSKEFCRIHFCSGSTHFYMVCVQQILLDCCIRNCWGEKKRFCDFKRSHHCIRFQIWSHCFWMSKKTTPKPKTLCIDPDIQHQECCSDPSHRVFLFPFKLHWCWQGRSDQHTGNVSYKIVSTTQYQFTEL